MITILVRPFFYSTFHIANNIKGELFCFWIIFPMITKEDCRYLVQANIAQRNSCTTILKELINTFFFSKTTSEGSILIKNWCISWSGFLGSFHTVNQGIFRDIHTLIEDFPELVQVAFGLKSDTRKVDCHDP